MECKSESVVCTVDEYGTISPCFKEICKGSSSGFLKYFNNLKGGKVRITIEILEGGSDES